MWMSFHFSDTRQAAQRTALLLAVITLVAFGLNFNAELFQQEKNLLRNPYVQAKGLGQSALSPFFSRLGTVGLDQYRPLSVSSLRWNALGDKENPVPFRVVNWILHWAVAFLIYLTIRAWSGHAALASLAALIFAVHPAAVSAAASLAGREEVLFVFLGLLAWYLHLQRGRTDGRVSLNLGRMAAPLCFLAALLSHEKALVFFFLMIAADASGPSSAPAKTGQMFEMKENLVRRWVDYTLWAATFLVYALWKYAAIGVRPSSLTGRVETVNNPLIEQGFWASLANGWKLGGMYLVQMVSPFRPRGDLYDFSSIASPADPGLLGTVLLWIALSVFAGWMAARRSGKALFLWFLVLGILPLMNWLSPTPHALSITYAYLPLVGVALALAGLFSGSPGRGKGSPAGVWAGRAVLVVLLALNVYYSWERKTEKGWLLAVNQSDPSCLKAAVRLAEREAPDRQGEKYVLPIRTAARLNPDSALAQSELARALAGSGQLEEAEKSLDRSRSLSPNLADPWLVQGNILELQKKLNEARAAYEQGLKRQPASVRVLNALGSVHVLLDQNDQALAYFQKAIELNPGSSIAWLNMGIVAQNLRQVSRSVECLEKAVRMEPTLLLAYLKLGDIYMLTNRIGDALGNFRNAQQLFPESVLPALRLGEANLRAKRYDDAVRTYHQGLQNFPKVVELILGLAATYREAEDFPHAEEQYQKALALDPKYVDTHMAMGLMYYRQQNFRKALDAYQKVVELDPKNATPYFNIGNIYLNIKQFSSAVDSYKKALELDPSLPQPYYNMGKALEEMKNYEEAIGAYEQFIKVWKGEPALLGNIQKRIQEMREELRSGKVKPAGT